MKNDMAGAAAILAAIQSAAMLRLQVAVTAYLPLAENVIGPAACRPGDVIKMRDGSHVEIRNTDAEGRLVLADALTRAAEHNPDCLLSVATLTGAQRVALGNWTSAVMGDSRVAEMLAAAGRHTGERIWPMPLPDDILPALKSDIADIANWNEGTEGGMARGGLFLGRFVPPGMPWAHLDIAGPAFHAGPPDGYTHTGGTGVPTRTLIEFLSRLSREPECVNSLRRPATIPATNSTEE